MEICGSLVVLFACLVMVYYGEKILSAENVGMIFSFAMRVTATLNGIVRSNSQIETAFVSVERLIEYMNLPSEVLKGLCRSCRTQNANTSFSRPAQ